MKIFEIISRETKQVFAYALTREKAEQIQADIQRREYEIWKNELFPKIKEQMEKSFAHMSAGNNVVFTGEVVDPCSDLADFLHKRLNGQKYNDDGEPCNCANSLVCDCTYKTADSIDVVELEVKE